MARSTRLQARSTAKAKHDDVLGALDSAPSMTRGAVILPHQLRRPIPERDRGPSVEPPPRAHRVLDIDSSVPTAFDDTGDDAIEGLLQVVFARPS